MTTWDGTDVFEHLTSVESEAAAESAEPVHAAADLIELGVLTITA